MKSTQTKVYRQLLYIDFRINMLKSELEAGLTEESYYRKALQNYKKQLLDIEREYKLYPNQKFYIRKLKLLIKEELVNLL